MNIFNDNEEGIAFTLGLFVGAIIATTMIIFVICSDEPTKHPTVKCTNGRLYDVSYDGNITILEKRPFTTCEER